MSRIFGFYKNLLQNNRTWIRRAGYLAAVSFVIGGLTFFIRPELVEEIRNFVEELVGEDELALNFSSVWLLFTNNLRAVLISLFGGVILGLLPLFTIAVNFFAMGFIFALFAFGTPISGADLPPGILLYLIAILPHGIIEIPALLIGAGLGLKFGFFWTRPNPESSAGQNFVLILKEIFTSLPLLVAMLFLAAIIEIFITGALIEKIIK